MAQLNTAQPYDEMLSPNVVYPLLEQDLYIEWNGTIFPNEET